VGSQPFPLPLPGKSPGKVLGLFKYLYAVVQLFQPGARSWQAG
jgi:hypothetical protein